VECQIIENRFVSELSLENQAGTGEAGLGFLEFGDIERCDVEASCFYTGARARERRGENNCFSKHQGVGGMWFGGIDFDPVVAGKGCGIEPSAIGE